jgi:hypothetical protein
MLENKWEDLNDIDDLNDPNERERIFRSFYASLHDERHCHPLPQLRRIR